MDNKIWNPDDDRKFEQLVKTLSGRDTKKKKRVQFDGPYDGLDMDPRLMGPIGEEYEEDDSNDLYVRDYSRPGPGFSRDFGLSFWLPLLDKGNGEVDIRNIITGESGTFTRATIATTVDRNGLVKQVASGVPRSYYDPATGEYLGYLAEGARTNLLVRSEELDNASWTKTRCSITANATVAPDGATTADKIVEDSTAASTHIAATPSWTSVSGTPTALSIFAKAGERSRVRIGISTNHITGTGANGVFTLTGDGTAAVLNDCTATIVKYPNGWYRCSITFTPTASAVGSSFIYLDNGSTSTYDGDGTSGLFAWGAQLEAGSFASSYIPTTTAAVTRNADVLTYDSSGNAEGAQGALYVEATLQGELAVGSSHRYAVAIETAASAAELVGLRNRFSVEAAGSVVVSSSEQGSVEVGTLAIGTPAKLAVAWNTNYLQLVKDGTAGTADNSITAPSPDTIEIGAWRSSAHWFGTIRNVRIWKKQMPDAALQALTA